jgi:hypothetical protein
MAKTIGQLTELAATPDSTDIVPIEDGGVTKKISVSNLTAATLGIAGNKTVAAGTNLALATTTGTKIGTATNQLLGFWNATPVDQPALTADLLDSLQEVGLIASGAGNTPLDLTSGALTCGAVSCGAVTATSFTSVPSTGAITSSSATAGIGYATGAGGAETQLTSKSTSVTLNTVTGRITMHNAALSANTTVTFTLTNSAIAANDLLVLNHVSGGTAGAYALNAQAAAGSASINVRNITAGSLSEAIVIGFAVIKSVVA